MVSMRWSCRQAPGKLLRQESNGCWRTKSRWLPPSCSTPMCWSHWPGQSTSFTKGWDAGSPGIPGPDGHLLGLALHHRGKLATMDEGTVAWGPDGAAELVA